MEVYKVKSLDGKPFDAKLFLVSEDLAKTAFNKASTILTK